MSVGLSVCPFHFAFFELWAVLLLLNRTRLFSRVSGLVLIDIYAHLFFLCKIHVYAGPIAPELIKIHDALASQHLPEVDLIRVFC